MPLYRLDLIQYRVGGPKVPDEEYLKAHADLLRQNEWIIDGYGSAASAWERFTVADTLVYIDLPLFTHYWWVTERLIKSLFIIPKGWPPHHDPGTGLHLHVGGFDLSAGAPRAHRNPDTYDGLAVLRDHRQYLYDLENYDGKWLVFARSSFGLVLLLSAGARSSATSAACRCKR